jgi:predicted phosphodiesterase
VKAGILSDSHDERGLAEDALGLFREEGVEVILHLGDVCRPETILALRDCGIPMIGVYGMPEIGGRKVLMAHSFDELQEEIGEGGKFDLILFGHTHRPLTMRIGRALILNPGEACGFISGKPTCAVIDLATMVASIREIRAGVAGTADLSGDAVMNPRKR